MRNGHHAGWLLVLVPACFHPSYDHPTCGPSGECPGGLTCNAQQVCEEEGEADTSTCFGSFIKVCFPTSADVPKVPAMLPSDLTIEIDTDSSSMCDQHNDRKDDYCVIAGAGFTLAVNQSIRSYGKKPLVLLSTTTMRLEATSYVAVNSTRTGGPLATGAGANPSLCSSGTAPELSGGGHGGSFGGKGGDGERLTGAAPTSGTAAPALTAPPMLLRGGCPGGTGADSGGMGGSGGGAVALIAKTSLELDGTVNASGAGGRGGPSSTSGGGGGGSGGMIVLDAPSITALGTLFANGGGGGQGGAGTGTGMGSGADGGESSEPLTAASAGDNGTTVGGSGGAGSAGTTTSRLLGGNGGAYAAAALNGGGGGGGGGAGFIRAPGVTTNISPPSFVP